MPSWSDKLVGEVMRLLLEAYYEPQFSDRSHGFRPHRGCHTALKQISRTWTGVSWFIEADIHDCFGSINHEVLLSILAERIHDGRFVELIRRMLKAGYVEDWIWKPTLSGAPQGGVVSPVLSNIYLDKLDKFVEDELIPRYTSGHLRVKNREYQRIGRQMAQARKAHDIAKMAELERRRRKIPSQDMSDPDYRRLRYVRYADDQLFGFAGPKVEAEQIKQQLAAFLRDQLHLELSQTKTLITHARTGRARFLGYDIGIANDQGHRHGKYKRRALGRTVILAVPPDVARAKAATYLKGRKPRSFRSMHQHSDLSIIGWYGAIYRGVVNYYKLAGNLRPLARLRWAMETSMLKTLAGKHKVSVTVIANKHRRHIATPYGPRVCFEAQQTRDGRPPLTARFGEIQLIRDWNILHTEPATVPVTRPGIELARRATHPHCELCHRELIPVEAHQIKNLQVLDPAGPAWQQIMTQKRRKTLFVCGECHAKIHQTKPFTPPSLESHVP